MGVLVTKIPDSNGRRLWAVWIRTSRIVSLEWLVAVSNVEPKILSPCILPRTCGRLVLTEQDAGTKRERSDFAVRDGESLRNYFIATVKMSALLYVSPGSHL